MWCIYTSSEHDYPHWSYVKTPPTHLAAQSSSRSSHPTRARVAWKSGAKTGDWCNSRSEKVANGGSRPADGWVKMVKSMVKPKCEAIGWKGRLSVKMNKTLSFCLSYYSILFIVICNRVLVARVLWVFFLSGIPPIYEKYETCWEVFGVVLSGLRWPICTMLWFVWLLSQSTSLWCQWKILV